MTLYRRLQRQSGTKRRCEQNRRQIRDSYNNIIIYMYFISHEYNFRSGHSSGGEDDSDDGDDGGGVHGRTRSADVNNSRGEKGTVAQLLLRARTAVCVCAPAAAAGLVARIR